jgi:transketolase
MAGTLTDGWEAALPVFAPKDGPVATRKAGRRVLNAIADKIPNLIGGAADLAESTLTVVDSSGSFTPDDRSGRNIHYGIREHAMGSLGNGMAAHGGVIPFGSTFFVFSDYQRPAIRLAALSGYHNIFVFTHDSVGLGEDGPTHQPVEHLASLRAMPGVVVIRPADANEVSWAWKVAMERGGPSVIVLTRQSLPILDRSVHPSAEGLTQGAYVVSEAAGGTPKAILIATGSEVTLALQSQEALAKDGIPVRVVSMPSWELFAEQPQTYRDTVLPPSITARVSIEAASSFGWERWVGSNGTIIGIDRFGASAPASVVLEKLGISVANVTGLVKQLGRALQDRRA